MRLLPLVAAALFVSFIASSLVLLAFETHGVDAHGRIEPVVEVAPTRLQVSREASDSVGATVTVSLTEQFLAQDRVAGLRYRLLFQKGDSEAGLPVADGTTVSVVCRQLDDEPDSVDSTLGAVLTLEDDSDSFVITLPAAESPDSSAGSSDTTSSIGSEDLLVRIALLEYLPSGGKSGQ